MWCLVDEVVVYDMQVILLCILYVFIYHVAYTPLTLCTPYLTQYILHTIYYTIYRLLSEALQEVIVQTEKVAKTLSDLSASVKLFALQNKCKYTYMWCI